ncbi:hypothetical protein [Flavobacterium xinjiangense]|uniref:Uncharacterized protein n=1 Tax=Flavobacterium xinjiangense TaxID=178356 RepID=A0A1M7PUL4_9FLAO|nr:hypothetical protein [Flavobacterium xinjiangense]SHN21142.1 hypothetical protein SAMN05216269_12319 [Flavobacterium xinjiangense]
MSISERLFETAIQDLNPDRADMPQSLVQFYKLCPMSKQYKQHKNYE